MADYRGPYTPGDEPPLTFERRRREAPREPRRSGPAPVTLILSLVLLLGVGGAVAFMYRAGVRGPAGAPEPVGAPIRDVRIAAPPQAQPADPAAGLSIYKPDAAPAAPAFAPPPEQPTPRPGEAAAPLAAPAPSASAAAVPAPASGASVAAASLSATKPAVETPRGSAGKPAAAKPRSPASIDSLIAENTLAPPPRPKHPAAKAPVASPTKATPSAVADEPNKKAEAAKDETAAGGQKAVVQIGAFSSRDLAEAAAAHGHAKHIAEVTRPDGTVLWRASLTGFASRDEASAFCAKLKSSGASCFVPR